MDEVILERSTGNFLRAHLKSNQKQESEREIPKQINPYSQLLTHPIPSLPGISQKFLK